MTTIMTCVPAEPGHKEESKVTREDAVKKGTFLCPPNSFQKCQLHSDTVIFHPTCLSRRPTQTAPQRENVIGPYHGRRVTEMPLEKSGKGNLTKVKARREAGGQLCQVQTQWKNVQRERSIRYRPQQEKMYTAASTRNQAPLQLGPQETIIILNS